MRLTKHSHATFSAIGMAALFALSACGSAGDGQGTSTGTIGNKNAPTVTEPASSVTLDLLKQKVDMSQCDKPTRTIKHDLGTTAIKGTPKRVIALEISFADALAASGVKSVGIADDNKPARIAGLKQNITDYKSVGLRSAPNLAVISSLKPDLIIADTTRDKAIYGQLNGIAPTVSLTSIGAGYGSTLAVDLQISSAVNQCSTMEKALTTHFKTMNDLIAKVPPGENRTVLYADILAPDFAAHGGGQWEPQILSLAGLKSVLLRSPGQRFEMLTLERVFSLNPDVMFLGRDPQPTVVDKWKTSPIWKKINAVKNEQVFEVEDSLWSAERGIKTSEIVLQQAVDHLH